MAYFMDLILMVRYTMATYIGNYDSPNKFIMQNLYSCPTQILFLKLYIYDYVDIACFVYGIVSISQQ